MTVSRRQSGRFHQHLLNVFVPLLGNRHAHYLVGRTLLGAAQSAVADGFLDRSEAGSIADLQGPGQRCDRADSGDRLQPSQPLGQQRIPFQGADQCSIQLVARSICSRLSRSRGRILSLISSLVENSSAK